MDKSTASISDDLQSKRMSHYPSTQTIISKARHELVKSRDANPKGNLLLDFMKGLPGAMTKAAISDNEQQIADLFQQLNKEVIPEMSSII